MKTLSNKVKSRMGKSLSSVDAELICLLDCAKLRRHSYLIILKVEVEYYPFQCRLSQIYLSQLIAASLMNSLLAAANNAFNVSPKLVIDNRSVKTNWSSIAFLNYDF